MRKVVNAVRRRVNGAERLCHKSSGLLETANGL
jgi:hypothetical protein